MLPSMPKSVPVMGAPCGRCCCCCWLFLRSWASTSSIVMIFCISYQVFAEKVSYDP